MTHRGLVVLLSRADAIACLTIGFHEIGHLPSFGHARSRRRWILQRWKWGQHIGAGKQTGIDKSIRRGRTKLLEAPLPLDEPELGFFKVNVVDEPADVEEKELGGSSNCFGIFGTVLLPICELQDTSQTNSDLKFTLSTYLTPRTAGRNSERSPTFAENLLQGTVEMLRTRIAFWSQHVDRVNWKEVFRDSPELPKVLTARSGWPW